MSYRHVMIDGLPGIFKGVGIEFLPDESGKFKNIYYFIVGTETVKRYDFTGIKWLEDQPPTDEELAAIPFYIPTGVTITDGHHRLKAVARANARLDMDSQRLSSIDMKHPEEGVDDRIFSATDMADFAYRIAQEAMAAAFEGRKNINGKSLLDYVNEQLDEEEGG